MCFKLLHSWAILCLAITTLFWIRSFILFKIDVDFLLKMSSIPNASYISGLKKKQNNSMTSRRKYFNTTNTSWFLDKFHSLMLFNNVSIYVSASPKDWWRTQGKGGAWGGLTPVHMTNELIQGLTLTLLCPKLWVENINCKQLLDIRSSN